MDNLEKVKMGSKAKNAKPKQLLATPSNVRKASSIKERVRRLVTIFVYALFVGLGIYHIQTFAIDNGALLGDTSALFYKTSAFVVSILLIGVNAFYLFYSAKVQSNLTWGRMAKHLVNGFIPLIGVILLAVGVLGKIPENSSGLITGSVQDAADKVSSGTNIFIYMVAVGVACSAGWMFVENIIQRKRFPNAFKISRNLLPGVLVALVGVVILSTKTSILVAKWGDLVMPVLIFLAGAVMVFFASALSFRSSDYGNKLKKLIKYGYVSHLVVTFTILTCFLFSKTDLSTLSRDSFGMVTLVVEGIATVAMIAYIIISSRLKRNLTTNPIHNRILLMSYLGFVNVMGLLAIFTAPEALSSVDDKSNFSFTFLGLTSLFSLLTVMVAGVMAFMTVEFKGFASIAMAAMQIALVLFLTMVIFSERDVAIITNLMGRFIALLIYATTLVVYLLFEAYWIIYLFLGEKSDRKELKRAAEALKAKEEQEEGQNG